jgi:23S rRNA (adenine2503-C2)-methyltransferase
MSNLPASLRAELAERFTLDRPEQVLVTGSEDTTRKFLFSLRDDQMIETVLIPATPGRDGSRAGRRTLCVSSQVGCAYGCRFCASGIDGWKRHLTPDEIVGQFLQVEHLSGQSIQNLVFMGMGEPFANYENVMKAITILNAEWGLNVGARHITVSTSGLAPQIRQFAAQPLQLRLAISLHGATDEVRQQIMPVNRKYPLAELFDACREYQASKKQKISFEYILIKDLNDSPEQARELGRQVRRFDAKVNLIPYNTVTGFDWERPGLAEQDAFLKILTQHGASATIRREKGHDINAACGQLRLRRQKDVEPATLSS